MPDFTAANVIVGVSTIKLDGVSIGYTTGGVMLSLTTTRVDKDVDQSYAIVGIFKVRESYELKTTLAEMTLANLKLIWEQPASIVSTPAAIGVPPKDTLNWGQAPTVVEHTLEFKGKSPQGYSRTFTVLKAVVFSVGDIGHHKDKITEAPVVFRILPDVTQPAGQEYGTIVDITGLALTWNISVNDLITHTENVNLVVV
jgi:hypothetical protein